MPSIIVNSQEIQTGAEFDNLVFKALLDGSPINIIIPLPAIANRRMIYGLATDEEAVDAILREHYTREKILPVEGWPLKDGAGKPRLRAETLEEKRTLAGGMRAGITIQRPPLLARLAMPQ